MDNITLMVLAVSGVVCLLLLIFIITSIVSNRKRKRQGGSKPGTASQKKGAKQKELSSGKPVPKKEVQKKAQKKTPKKEVQKKAVSRKAEQRGSRGGRQLPPLDAPNVHKKLNEPVQGMTEGGDAGSGVQSIVMKSEPDDRPNSAQIRKKRVVTEDGPKLQEDKILFAFPDDDSIGNDPLMGDRVSNAQLDHLLDREFAPRDLADGASGSGSSGEGSILFMDNDVNVVDDVVLQDDDKEEASPVDLDGMENAGTELEDLSLEETSNASDTEADSGIIKFNNLHFKSRNNSADFTELLPEHYEPHYKAGAAKLVIFHDSVKLPKQDGMGMMALYNSHVYDGTHPKEWDNIFEVRVHRGQRVSVDLGVGVFLPEGYALQLVTAPELEQKFGLRLVSNSIIGREEAANSIIVEFVGCSDISYVAKNQSLLRCRVVKVA